MVDLFITNIRGLVQTRANPLLPLAGADMANLPVMEDAFLIVNNGRIEDFGPMSEIPSVAARTFHDASGKYILPTFVDSHTHIIFPTSREEEFVMKIKGLSYQEIASRGGGILNSARKLAQTSTEHLLESAMSRLDEIASTGTGAVEIKSGYGLSLEGELKMLRVARELKERSKLAIRTTFLGAHAVPAGISKEEYIRSVVYEMIPAIASEALADYIDVFCETGFFSPDDTERILEAGIRHGMKPRIHANQLNRSGGVQVGVKMNAVSVDHLETIGEEEITALKGSGVFATALPGAAFFLNLPMPPARRLIEEQIPVIIASDFNPGSSPSGNMMLMLALACIRMRLTPEEVINAATVNAACSLALQDEYGSISRGKIASFIITRPIPSLAYLFYAFGSDLIDRVYLRGSQVR